MKYQLSKNNNDEYHFATYTADKDGIFEINGTVWDQDYGNNKLQFIIKKYKPITVLKYIDKYRQY